jgi:hypothetical protein
MREDSKYLFGNWAVTIRGDGPILEVIWVEVVSKG